jgi:hypothetical protein
MGTTAQSCCANPQSCGGKSVSDDLQKLEDTASDAQDDNDQDGLNKICSQAKSAADASGDLQLSYANVCSSKHVPCSDVCGQVWNKWNQTANSCTGNNCGQLSSIVAQMWQQQTTCEGLNASQQIMIDKANQQAINSSIAQICRDRIPATPPTPAPPGPTNTNPPGDNVAQTSPSPSNTQPQQQPDQQQPQTQQPAQAPTTPNQPTQTAQALPMGSTECGAAGNISACVNCAEHPEYPSCNGSASTAALPVVNEGASGPKAGIANATGMNVGSALPAQNFDASSVNGTQPASATSAAMNPYANGQKVSGAGIGVFPSLDKNDLSGSLLSRAQFIAAKKGVDFSFAGERGGNGYSGYSNGTQGGTGFEGMSRGLASKAAFKIAQAGKNYIGLDLKRYLPGQFGAGRGIYGMNNVHSEIGPMSTDMFQRVSLRFKLICFQHQLLDCN